MIFIGPQLIKNKKIEPEGIQLLPQASCYRRNIVFGTIKVFFGSFFICCDHHF